MPRARKESAVPPDSGAVARWLVQFLLPVILGAGLLVGVLALGRWATGELSTRAQPLRFQAIACIPPPGMEREEFLSEVQYLADLPDEIDLQDATLPPRLAGAFSLHPWVASVQRVEKGPDRLSVLLVYRVPVLAVRLPGPREEFRAVDEEGVLLPASAGRELLPIFRAAKSPAGRPGSGWGDARVRAAARTVGYLAGQRSSLGLEGCAVEVKDERVTLVSKGRRVVWGRPPGEEASGEPMAEEKVEMLRSRPEGTVDLSLPPRR